MDGLNNHAEIMTQDLAQHLIELADIALAAHRVTELALDHGEGCLDVRPLVVMV